MQRSADDRDGPVRTSRNRPEAATARSDSLAAVPVERTLGSRSLRRGMRRGFVLSCSAALALALVIGQTSIAGAVISFGMLVVDSGSKPVQHPIGGVVAEVLVRAGERVDAGAVVVRLDDTVSSARLSSATIQLLQNQARHDRLDAERSELDAVVFKDLAREHAWAAGDYERIVAAERRQFETRWDEFHGTLAQLDQRIAQSVADERAAEIELRAVQDQLELVGDEHRKLLTLKEQQLVAASRVSELERSLAALRGTEGRLRSTLTAARSKTAELRVTKIQVQRLRRSEIGEQLAEAEVEMTRLIEQVVTSRDELARRKIRAPIAGRVHDLAALGPGTVVQPGETLMILVPETDRLVGEVRVRPSDVDQLFPGQAVNIQFSAFDRGSTPMTTGRVAEISPDLVTDDRTGAHFYVARIVPDETGALITDEIKLVPGMPIEAFIRTDDRTILSYLLKPLTDQLNRAFR